MKNELESVPMRLLRAVRMPGLAWSLRRLHVPVDARALVLEVGSGGNPYPRANVLLDAYEVTRERHFEALVADRPTVLGLGERLPFRDDAFDFVIASHVLEHSTDAPTFLKELERVARAGYIETPDALFERLNPYRDHRYEVTVREGELLLREKRSWKHDPEVVELFDAKFHGHPDWQRYIRSHAFAFHVRHYWSRESGGIRFRVLPCQHGEPIDGGGEADRPNAPPSIRTKVLAAIRAALSQTSRNRNVELGPLLQCPDCRASDPAETADAYVCRGCGSTFARRGQLVRVMPQAMG